MTKLIHVLLLLLGVLVIQVLTMETVEFGNATDSDYGEENRLLLNGIIAAKCRNVLNHASTVLPTISKITLSKLSNNRLYYFSPPAVAMRVTFDQARIFCRDHGMHLVTINSDIENIIVYTRAVALGLAGAAPGSWIGYRDVTLVNNYQWVQPGVKASTPTFFAVGFPLAAQCAQYTATAAAPAATSWTTSACVTLLPFICEMEPPCSLVL